MKHKTTIIVAAILIFFLALGITLYPLISNYVNQKYASTIYTKYEEMIQNVDETELQEARSLAQSYNQALAPVSSYDKEGISEASQYYDSLLNLGGNGIMGYIEIPCIQVNLPIYHGTDTETLERGVGHLLGSSLPVGGSGTHAVLSGHSGMAGQKMFTDLLQMKTGDIFYLHSRLLERACRLNDKLGGGSITALPIVETQAGDISAYIPTNVISITDGQIFLTTDLFNQGQRPAVDSGLSVSRVGSSAQWKARKSVASSLKIELANYNERLDFSRFGSDLDSVTQNVLKHGSVLREVLKQKQYDPLSRIDEIIDIYVAQSKALDNVALDKIPSTLSLIRQSFHSSHPEAVKEREETKKLSDETKKKIDESVSDILSGAR